jgi:hypothetical protein
VVALSLGGGDSWWGRAIRDTATEFHDLAGRSSTQQAAAIAATSPDILVDLNGHTLGSGLGLFGLGLAQTQVSYLGYASTTGSTSVGHILTDAIASPAEQAHHFSERLALASGCFFANGFAAMQRHVRLLPRATPRLSLGRPQKRHGADHQSTTHHPHPRPDLHRGLAPGCRDSPAQVVVLASFSNFQKMNRAVVGAWGAVMRRVPCSVLWLLRHDGHAAAVRAIRRQLEAAGISRHRLFATATVSWLDHVRVKSAADLLLDTQTKNGHTSVADALWAGVPVVTIQGATMNQRVATSLLAAASGCVWRGPARPAPADGQPLPCARTDAARAGGIALTTTVSLKEYEAVAARLAGSDVLRAELRRQLEEQAAGAPASAQSSGSTNAADALWSVAGQARRIGACLHAIRESTAASAHVSSLIRQDSGIARLTGLPMHVVCGDTGSA